MNRWWAPQEPLSAPDDVVKAAFVPAGDENDVSSTLLGIHRAVAGAIEHKARSGVLDEVGLVDAMAQMREQVAGDAVGAISKSLDPTYAGLLVRDYCDDAELGALKVYRAAVSKGVPAPVAAKRAAAIYGVPYGDAGKYLPVATDPKANPAVIDDVADRALMSHVMKICDLETKQTVSKDLEGAELAEFNRRVRRDNLGQFATQGKTSRPPVRDRIMDRLGLADAFPSGIQVPAPWETALAEQQTQAPEATPQTDRAVPQRSVPRRQAPQKQRSVTRKMPERTSLKRSAAAAGAPAVERSVTRSTDRSVSRSIERKVVARNINRSLQDKGLQHKPQPHDPLSPKMPRIDLLDPITNESRAWETLNHDRVAYINGSHWSNMHEIMRNNARIRGNDGLVARLGHVLFSEDTTHSADDYRDKSLDRRGVKEHEIDMLARRYQSYDGPVIEVRSFTEAEAQRYGGAEVYGDHLAVNLSTEMTRKGYVPNIEVVPGYGEDDSDRWYVIGQHWEQGGNSAAPVGPPLPRVVEVVIHDASGEVADLNDKGLVELNPNQAYRFSLSNDSYSDFDDVYWDDDNHVLVQRIHAHPIDEHEVQEYFRKADDNVLQGAELHQFNQEHPRDSRGQFSRKARTAERSSENIIEQLGFRPQQIEVPDVMTEQPQLRQVPQRVVPRAARRVAPVSLQRRMPERRSLRARTAGQEEQATADLPQRSTLRQVSREMNRGVDRQISRSAGAKADDIPPLVLPRDVEYKVFSSENWSRLAESFGQEDIDALFSGESIPLTGMAAGTLFSEQQLDAPGVRERLKFNVEAEITNQGVFEPDHTELVDEHDFEMDKAKYIQRIFEKFPNTPKIEVIPRGDGLVELSWPDVKIPSQVIVDVPLDFNPDAKYDLTYVGTYRAKDLYGDAYDGPVHLGGMMDSTGYGMTIPNPDVDIFQVIAPVTHRFRVEER